MKARYYLSFFMVAAIMALLLFFVIELLFPSLIKNITFRSPQIDTIGHFIVFFILTWLVHTFIKLPLASTFTTLGCYGALSELGQYYLGFRNGEFSDFFADIAGIGFFILLQYIYLYYKKTLQIMAIKKQTMAKQLAKTEIN